MNKDSLSSQPTRVSLVPYASLSTQDGDIPLVKASRCRNQEAFALLVSKHQRAIFTLAWHILQDDEEANTITQETFLAAWQALPSLPENVDFSLWLSHLVYQKCMQQSKPRKGKRSKIHPINRRERKQQQSIVALEYLPALPTISRVVLVLRYLQELTYEEMALVLTLPLQTVKAHLFQARKLLKEQIQANHLSDAHSGDGEHEMQVI